MLSRGEDVGSRRRNWSKRQLPVAVAVIVTMWGVCSLPDAAASIAAGDGLWRWQNPAICAPLSSVDFADATHGWAVGRGGTVLATTDGGRSWTAQKSPTTVDLNGVCFVDAQHGWAVGQVVDTSTITRTSKLPGIIIATVDGGRHWTVQDPGISDRCEYMSVRIHSVAFADPLHGCAVGLDATMTQSPLVLVTSDGGSHWTETSPPGIDGAFTSVTMADADHGWAVGRWFSPAVYATNDGGRSWSLQHAGSGVGEYLDVCCTDSDHVWAVGLEGGVSRIASSVDGGATWAVQSPEAPALSAVTFRDDRHGWAVGSSPYAGMEPIAHMLRTSDGGLHWDAVLLPGHMVATDIAFGDGLLGVVVGGDSRYADTPTDNWQYMVTTTDGGASWAALPGSATNDLHGVAFTDRRRGLAVGDDGTMLATDDGGDHWMLRASMATADLHGITFRGSTGCIVGAGGSILVSNDGGGSWTLRASGTAADLNGVSFADSRCGWIVGDRAVVLATEDGGAHWSPKDCGLPAGTCTLSAVWFIDRRNGWAVGQRRATSTALVSGCIIRTTDGGEHWRQVAGHGDGMPLRGICFSDLDHGWIVGGLFGACAMRTTDGGRDWPTTAVNPPGSSAGAWNKVLRSVTFSDRLHGWAVGDDGTVAATSNGGKAWHVQNSGTTQDLYGAWCVDKGHAWVVGKRGTILAGPMPVPVAPNSVRVRRGAVAKIRYKISDSSVVTAKVTIKIRNARGRTVKTLRCRRRPPNKWLRAKFRCRLKRGSYRFSIYVLDSAGNRQLKPAGNRLVVR